MYATVSERGAFLLAAHEALVPTRYRDLAQVDTFGIGHTASAGKPDPREMSFAMPANPRLVYREAWDLFLRDLKPYTAQVVKAFGGGLEQHQLDGLVMWHFNTGGALSSSAVSAWRAGDREKAVRIIKSWNKVTIRGVKQVSEALVRRREEETSLILSGRYYPAQLAVYGTDGRGNVIWRPLESFNFGEWAEFLGGPEVRPTPSIWARLALFLKGLKK